MVALALSAGTQVFDVVARMVQRLSTPVNNTDADGRPQLSVGFGGDIPIFPPFVLVGSVVTGLLMRGVFGSRSFIPPSMNRVFIRVAIFAATVGSFSVGSASAALVPKI
jgi:hypothetical protein